MILNRSVVLGKGENMDDVFPQYINAIITQSAANTFTQVEIPLPTVQDIGGGKALVVEILRVFFGGSTFFVDTASGGSVSAQLTKKTAVAILEDNDSTVIASCRKYKEYATAVGFTEILLSPHAVDTTDGQGHGYLAGQQKLFLGVNSVGCTAVRISTVKILYRLRKVTAGELLGTIQE